MPVRSKTRRGEPGLVLTSAGADNLFRPAAFCSPRFRRCYFALACFALPRRNGSTTRPTLGRHRECMDDQFLRRFLSLLHLPDLLLARPDFAICPGWDGRWRPAGLARFDTAPFGKPSRTTLLHSEPLARPARNAGNRSTSHLRMVAHHAPRRVR